MKQIMFYTLAIALLAACGRDEVETYRIPKEKTAVPVVAPSSPRRKKNAHETSFPKGFTADTPAGWTKKPGSGMRMASWSIEGTSIDFYLIALAMGNVPSNVNRWRRQIGLPEMKAEEIDQSIEVFEADGKKVRYAELYNEEKGRGIIAAIADLSSSYWYFTAKGSVKELKSHASGIRGFIESIQFEGTVIDK